MFAEKEAPSSSPKGGESNWEFGYTTANPKSYSTINQISKEMRFKPTRAETILWEYLRKKSTGHRIRRQHIIHNFIVDFVCLSKKLVIEVDGKIHDKQKEYDKLRTEYLNVLGYHVVRFKNEQVMRHPQKVFQKIKEILNS